MNLSYIGKQENLLHRTNRTQQWNKATLYN